jgi:pentatricopeptide repeat protein
MRKNSDNIRVAIEYFEQAVEQDPSFAKAYAGLADCYALRNNVAYGLMGAKEAMDKAGYTARKAVEAGDTLAESHTSLGLVNLRYAWMWGESEREFRRAIELDPYYAPAHYWYTNLLIVLRRFDDAIRESQIAQRLDPYSPLHEFNHARVFYYARRYDEAAALLRPLIEQHPDYPQSSHLLALVLLQQGNYQGAIETLEKLHSKSPLLAAAALGYAYGKAGRHEDALGILREMERRSTPQEPIPPQEKELVYIGMGDRDRAFAMLEEVYQERFPGFAFITTDPIYDDLRSDPRFADFARRADLVP